MLNPSMGTRAASLVILLIIPNRLHLARLDLPRQPLARIVEGLPQLSGQRAGLAVADARAVKLHRAEPEDAGEIAQ